MSEKPRIYLANERENEIVDGDITIQSESEANEENEMMQKNGRNKTAIQPVPQHIPLVISKVTT